jgi:hypothetical protein
MARAASKPTTNQPAFLSTVARIHLPHLFRGPYVAEAFKARSEFCSWQESPPNQSGGGFFFQARLIRRIRSRSHIGSRTK